MRGSSWPIKGGKDNLGKPGIMTTHSVSLLHSMANKCPKGGGLSGVVG